MKPVLFLLFLGETLSGMQRTVLGPVYPEIALHRSVSNTTIGVIFALSPIAGIVWSLLISYIPIKSRRGMLLLRCVLMSLSMGLVGLSVYFDRFWLITLSGISRILAGIGITYSDTAGYGLIASYEAENIEKFISYFEMSEGFGLTLGPVFASFVTDWLGFSWMCYLMAMVFVVYAPMIYLVEEPAREDVQSSASEVLLDSFAFTYVEICFSALDAFASPHLTSMGLSLNLIGVCYAMYATVYVAGCLLFGQFMSEQGNLSKTMKIAVFFLSISIAMTGPPSSIPVRLSIVIPALAATGAACGPLVIPAFPHLLSAVEGLGFTADDTLKDNLGSLSQAALSVGETLGYFAIGAGVQSMGYRNTVTTVGVVGVLYLAAFTGLYRERKSKVLIEDQGGE